MKTISAIDAARTALAANPHKPAMAVVHDSDDVRLVVFRLEPGQEVAPHTSKASVTLTVLEGSGILAGDGEESRCKAGDVVAYNPGELHGMKAEAEQLLLLASISPRPGSR